MTKEFVCINCPLGCRMNVTLDGQNVVLVSGNNCGRGEAYARQEAVRPLRVLTGNMKAEGSKKPFSVRSDAPVPKDLMLQCAALLQGIHPPAPIRAGDVIIPDILGTGARIVATRDFDIPL